MIGLEKVSVSFEGKQVLKDLTLELKEGKITALMGPSGQGKTTVLRLLAGLKMPDEGKVHTTQAAVCFQEARLFPKMTVLENLKAVLPAKKKDGSRRDKQEIAEICRRWLKKVHLEAEENAYPGELSGGMQKRAALARCLMAAEEEEWSLILLDEPFSALDEALRQEMRELVRDIAHEKTVLLITHDKEDGEIADHVISMETM